MSSGERRAEDSLAGALTTATHRLRAILQQARSRLHELDTRFVKEGISILVDGIAVYADLFKRTNSEDSSALELTIAKSSRTVKEVASELLDVEDEWNRFLCEIEGKEEKGNHCSTLLTVGDDIHQDFLLQPVTCPPHPAMTGGAAAKTHTLKDILRGSPQSATLFVFNRHFA